MDYTLNSQLLVAVNHAINDEWQQSHLIAQESNDPIACWIHAVLHKIEGDEGNSRYWYARSGTHHHEDYADPDAELRAIARLLDGSIGNNQHG
jgi:hypothetical protein